MTWKKRLSFAAVCLLLVLGIGAVWAYRAVHRRPAWYPQANVDPVAREAAARRAENEVAQTIDWAAARQAEERSRLGGGAAAAADPGRARTITFTEDELNAFFAKWSDGFGWQEKYGSQLSDPVIALHGGRVILAGNVKQFDAVVSLHFEPHVDPPDGLRLDLKRVLAGNFPMPEALFGSYRVRLENKLKAALPPLQQAARIRPDGTSNKSAIDAAMAKLFLQVLRREPAEPVLFIQANGGSVPVKVTDVKTLDHAVSVTVELMDAAEREAFLRRIREPQGTATAALNP
jgi:hypothetical protein